MCSRHYCVAAGMGRFFLDLTLAVKNVGVFGIPDRRLI